MKESLNTKRDTLSLRKWAQVTILASTSLLAACKDQGSYTSAGDTSIGESSRRKVHVLNEPEIRFMYHRLSKGDSCVISINQAIKIIDDKRVEYHESYPKVLSTSVFFCPDGTIFDRSELDKKHCRT